MDDVVVDGRRGRGRDEARRGARAATRRRKERGRKKAKTGGSVFVPARREGGRLLRGGGDEGDRRDGAKGTRQRERERKDADFVDFVAFETVAAAGGCHRHRRRRRRRVSSRRLAIRRVRAKTTNAAVARARVREDVAVRRVYSRNPESNSNCAACDRWRFSRGALGSRPTGGLNLVSWRTGRERRVKDVRVSRTVEKCLHQKP